MENEKFKLWILGFIILFSLFLLFFVLIINLQEIEGLTTFLAVMSFYFGSTTIILFGKLVKEKMLRVSLMFVPGGIFLITGITSLLIKFRIFVPLLCWIITSLYFICICVSLFLTLKYIRKNKIFNKDVCERE